MFNLANLIANRRWVRHTVPFAHITARDVFTAEFYEDLAGQLSDLIGKGLMEVPTPGCFSRNMKGYDAYGVGLPATTTGPLALFLSKPWRDMMCGLYEVEPTPYLFAGAHHHSEGGRSGFIHNDFNPVWFESTDRDELRTPDASACDFRTGEGPIALCRKVMTVRAVVVIYFLLNDHWQPGAGGETGLYSTSDADIDQPVRRCPPVNNSIVAFECTPASFHAFLANPGLARTSIIWRRARRKSSCSITA